MGSSSLCSSSPWSLTLRMQISLLRVQNYMQAYPTPGMSFVWQLSVTECKTTYRRRKHVNKLRCGTHQGCLARTGMTQDMVLDTHTGTRSPGLYTGSEERVFRSQQRGRYMLRHNRTCLQRTGSCHPSCRTSSLETTPELFHQPASMPH